MPPEPQPYDDRNEDDLGVLCPRCAFTNAPEADFCARCTAPLSMMSTLDPFKRTLAAGALYRQAADGTPKLIGILGIWLLFLPLLSALPLSLARGGSALELTASYLGSMFAAVLLYRTTASFRRRRKDERAASEV